MRSFEDRALILPEAVLLDTSFVLDALVPTQKKHDGSRLFLEDLAEHSVVVFFSRLLDLELAEAAFRVGLRSLGHRDPMKARRDGRARRRGAKVLDEVIEAWAEVRAVLNWAVIEIEEVLPAIHPLMAAYGLSSYDAIHAASARFAGGLEIVTLDAGFAALPAEEFRLLVDSSRVASCRARRGAAPHPGRSARAK